MRKRASTEAVVIALAGQWPRPIGRGEWGSESAEGGGEYCF